MKNLEKNKTIVSNAMLLFMADNIKSAKYDPDTLWGMVCNTFDVNPLNEVFGSIFDEIWENNYIKFDILSLGSKKIIEIYNGNKNEFNNFCK